MNRDQEFLLKRSQDNISAAEILIEKGFHGIAASRLYYAIFYAAEALLLHRGLSFSSHTAVISAFGREFSKTGDMPAKFHQYLLKSQELRHSSDYVIGSSVSQEAVFETLDWAREFLAVTKRFLDQSETQT